METDEYIGDRIQNYQQNGVDFTLALLSDEERDLYRKWSVRIHIFYLTFIEVKSCEYYTEMGVIRVWEICYELPMIVKCQNEHRNGASRHIRRLVFQV